MTTYYKFNAAFQLAKLWLGNTAATDLYSRWIGEQINYRIESIGALLIHRDEHFGKYVVDFLYSRYDPLIDFQKELETIEISYILGLDMYEPSF